MEADYSKREIDSHFEEVYHRLDDVNLNLTGLNAKVAIQNGKVAKLDGKSLWLTGVGVTAIFLFGIIISLVVYSFQLSLKNQEQSILIEVRAMIDKK